MTEDVPSYELYGELLAGSAPDPVHLEPIRERSSKHNWTIRVHNHRRLAQVFLFRSSGVRLTVGHANHKTDHPTLLVVPPGVPHGFRFEEDVVGDVLSIRVDAVSEALQSRLYAFDCPTGAVFTKPETSRFEDVVSLFEQLGRAYNKLDSHRVEIMKSIIDLITLYLITSHSRTNARILVPEAGKKNRQAIQAEQFCTLLEENFHRPWTVSEYASSMGLSASHLTRICRAVLSETPNALVRQRRILEAKLLLEYTGLHLSEVAYRSGFQDKPFFSRTFKSFVGVSPGAYRQGLDH